MPTITVTIQVGQQTYGKPKQITGPDLQRMVTAWRRELGQINTGTPEAPALRDRTDQEVLDGWCDFIMTGLKTSVRFQERQQAIQQAVDSTNDITLT